MGHHHRTVKINYNNFWSKPASNPSILQFDAYSNKE